MKFSNHQGETLNHRGGGVIPPFPPINSHPECIYNTYYIFITIITSIIIIIIKTYDILVFILYYFIIRKQKVIKYCLLSQEDGALVHPSPHHFEILESIHVANYLD